MPLTAAPCALLSALCSAAMAAVPAAAAPRLLLISGKASQPSGPAAGRQLSVVLPTGAPSSPTGLEAPQPARKRQRLTHLSPEEKALRR